MAVNRRPGVDADIVQANTVRGFDSPQAAVSAGDLILSTGKNAQTLSVSEIVVWNRTDAIHPILVLASGSDLNTSRRVEVHTGDLTDPDGTVTAPIGSLYVSTTSPALYQNQNGATTWFKISDDKGGENLAETLAIGNTSGGNDIIMSSTDAIRGTDSAVGSGEDLKLFGGSATGAVGDGGDLILQSGSALGGVSGAISISSAAPSPTYNSGIVSLYTADASSGGGSSGDLAISTGAAGAAGVAGYGGMISLFGGETLTTGATAARGGSVFVRAGKSQPDSEGGTVWVWAGDSAVAASVPVVLPPTAGQGGTLNLKGGNSSKAKTGGWINLLAGTGGSGGGAGGSIQLTPGSGGGGAAAGEIIGNGVFRSTNLKRDDGDPNALGIAGDEGAIFQRTTGGQGELWLNTNGAQTGWQRLAFASDFISVFTKIQNGQISPVLDQLVATLEGNFSDTGVYEGVSSYSNFVAGFAPSITREADEYGPYATFRPNGDQNDVAIEVSANTTGIRVQQRFVAVFKVTNTENTNAFRAVIGLSTSSASNAINSDSPAGEHMFLQKASGANVWRLFTSGSGGPNPISLNAAAGNITSSQNVPRYVIYDTTVVDQLTITILDEDFAVLDQVVITDPTLFPTNTSNLYPVVAIRQTGGTFTRLKLWVANVIVEADKLFEAAGAETPKPTLEQVLLAGNETGITSIVVSEGSFIQGETDGGVGQGSDLFLTSGNTLIAGNHTGATTLQTANHSVLNGTGNTGSVLVQSGEQQGLNATGGTGNVGISSGNLTLATHTGDSGDLTLCTGDHAGVAGTTGIINICTGSHTGSGGIEGSIFLKCGNGVASNAVPGSIQILSGSTSLNGVAGGTVTIRSGASGSIGSTGDFFIQTPNVQLEGNGGGITIASGDGGTNDGQGGYITLESGDGISAGPNAKGGNIAISGGNGTIQGGFITLTAGDSSTLDGASVVLTAGDQLGGGQGGNIVLTPGTGGVDGAVIVNGKLTVTGLIDPTGLVLTGVPAVPYSPPVGEGVLWIDDTDSDKLKYTNSGGTLIVGSGGATALNDLTDVTIAGPAVGEVLTYNGALWVNLPGGGGAPLVTVLALGNVTGANDLIVSTGQSIQGETDLILSEGPNPTDRVIISGLKYPVADGNPGDVLTTDGAGNLTFAPGGAGAGNFAEVFTQMQWGSVSPPPDAGGSYDLNGSGILHDTSDTSPGGAFRAVDADGLYHQGTGVAGAAETGFITTTEPTRIDAQFFFAAKFRITGNTNVRVFVGFTTGTRNDMATSDAPATAVGGYLGVGFSTVLAETNWHFIHNSGGGAGTRVDSGIAVDTAVHYVTLDARVPGQIEATIYDNDFVVLATTSIVANVPAPSTSMDVIEVLYSTVAPDLSLATYNVSLVNRADLLDGIGGGGTQNLAQVLLVGNESGGTPIVGTTNAGGVGGNLELFGGESTGGGGAGGEARLYGGTPDPLGNGNSGTVRILTPAGAGTGAGGSIYLLGGAGGPSGGDGSTISIYPGDGTGAGLGGALVLRTGSGAAGGGDPGDFAITLGSGFGGNVIGGDGSLTAGNGFGTGNGGSWTITGGTGGAGGGDGGSITFTPGAGAGGGVAGTVSVLGDLYVSGKLTVDGLIDPPGLLMSSSVAVPFTPVGTEGGIWVNSLGELVYTNINGDLNLSTAIGGGLGFLDGFLIAGYGFLSPGSNLGSPTSSGVFGQSSTSVQVAGATATYDSDVEGPVLRLSTAAAPTSESWVGTQDKQIWRDQKFKSVFKFQVTSPAHTDERIFVGYTNDGSTQLSSDSPIGLEYIGLQETLAGTNLEFVARGSGGAMTPVFAAVTDTSVWYLSIDFSNATQVTFQLIASDGQTVVTEHIEPISTLVPSASSYLQPFVGVRTDAGAVRDMDFYFTSVITRADIVDAVTGGGGGGGIQDLTAVLLVGNDTGGTPIKGTDATVGGNLDLNGGSSTGGGNGGRVNILSGSGDAGFSSGSVNLTTAAGDTAGGITITVGVSSATGGSDITVQSGETSAVAQTGGNLYLRAGNSVDGLSGSALLSSGVASAGSTGDVLVLTQNAGTNGSAGNVSVAAGAGDGTGAGGNVQLQAGAGGAGVATDGGITILAGSASAPVATDGNVQIVSSPDTNAEGALVQVERGTSTDSGYVYLKGGSGLGGGANGGNIILQSGAANGAGTNGSVFLLGSGLTPPIAADGSIYLESQPDAGGKGSSLHLARGQAAQGGDATLVSGNAEAATNNPGGALTLAAGSGDGVGLGGAVSISGGAATTNTGGSLSLSGGDTAAASQTGGGVVIRGGEGISTSRGGNSTLRGGNIGSFTPLVVGSSNGQGGHAFVLGGASDGTASGGRVYILGGESGASGVLGGQISIAGGAGRTGSNATGGSLYLSGGPGGDAGAPGGDIQLQGGNAGGVGLINGGSIYLTPGTGGNPATPGRIYFQGWLEGNASGYKWGTYTIPGSGTGPFTITFLSPFATTPRAVLITVESSGAVVGRETVVVLGSITTADFRVVSSSNLLAGDKIHWEVKL